MRTYTPTDIREYQAHNLPSILAVNSGVSGGAKPRSKASKNKSAERAIF
jgi:hypothetical protein